MSYGNARTIRRRAVLSGTALVALGLVLAASPSRATDWTGANSTDWFDPGNWSGGVPTNATGAVFNTVTPNESLIDGAAAEALAMNVGQTGNGALTIQNGGSLSSGLDTYIGYLAGATGAVTVTGAGSSWTNGIGVFVGVSGIGSLTVENGGVVNSAGEIRFGLFSSGSGTATVDGAGSSLTTGSLAVGDSGTGTLTIRNGGTVSTNSSFLGYGSGSSGAVTVDGAGSSWTNTGALYVSDAGTGTLTIRNGGTVSTDSSFLGFSSGSSGAVTVDGVGSSWTNTGAVYVGHSGTGTLTVQNDGLVSGTDAYLGRFANSTGIATVDGTGSSWSNTGSLFVGDSGTGTLTIRNGGAVSSDYGAIAVGTNSTGTVTVEGAGSSWVTTGLGAFYIGNSGTGTLTIRSGGTVGSSVGFVGVNAGSTGAVTVDGLGSSWNNTFIYLGQSGAGALTIQNSGSVVSTLGSSVGENAGSTGTVTVDGTGSSWTNGSDLYVGNSGTGTLTIQNGGAVSNTAGFMGYFPGSTGAVTVEGTGSSWSNASALYIGNSGSGVLTIQSGGAVSNTDGYIGRVANSTGAVTVDGAGSSWTSTFLNVGYAGSGALTIRNGGAVSNAVGYVGTDSGSIGTVTVDGAGSSWTTTGDLNVGYSGTGTLTVRNGGAVSAANVVIANQNTSSGTLNIGASSGQAAAAPGTLNATLVSFGSGTGHIVFNHTAASYAFNPVITGAGSVQVEAGTTILSGTHTYTGATTVNGGTLAVNGSIASSVLTTVNSGGTLGGTGTVGATTVASGGALAPGNSIGTLTVQGNLTFNAGGVYRVEVSPTASDRTNVTGTATLSGATVQAVALPGSFRQQTYTILNAAGGFGGTQFAGLTGSTFAPGARNPHLTYDLNNVYLVLDPGTLDLPAGTGGNQSSAAGAINHAVSNGATPPAAFDALHNMTDGQLSNALGQLSGQPGASTSQTGIVATGQFVGAVVDSAFGDGGGQGSASGGQGGALSYAQAPARTREATEAYAAVTPHDRRTPSFEQRWNVWASVYGGNSRVGGDASAGTSTTTSKIYGTAVGASYRFTRDTQAGFALGGAGSSFGLDDGLGGGKSDVFNIAIYGRHDFGAAYLSGLLGYSWQDTTTDRTVTISGVDRLHASFKAQALSARLEGGWRYATPLIGIAPYAAVQSTTFFLPSYSESVTSGSSAFALSYAAKSTTATRSELGARLDKAMLVPGGVFTLKAKTAWVHDWNTDREATATFQSLPGATFTTNGAQPSPNAALLSLGGEMGWHNGWTIAGNFDGEFSATTTGYAGKGSVRYAW